MVLSFLGAKVRGNESSIIRFVLADVRKHATCVICASGNSEDITISLWTLSRYRDPKKVHDLSPKSYRPHSPIRKHNYNSRPSAVDATNWYGLLITVDGVGCCCVGGDFSQTLTYLMSMGRAKRFLSQHLY